MVKDHHGTGYGAGEGGIIRQLMMVDPRVIGQAPRAQTHDAPSESGIRKKAFRSASRNRQSAGVSLEGARMPDAAETPFGGGRMRVQDSIEFREPEIGMRYNAGDLGLAGRLRGPLGCRGHELRFADGLHVFRPIGAVGRAALHEHGLHHLVPVLRVRPEFFKVIRQQRLRPEVMVRIDYFAAGIDHRFAHLAQPLRIIEHVVSSQSCILRL